MAISKPWVRTSGQLPSLHNSQQNNYWVKLLLLLESALKLNFEALELTENLNPLLTPSSINTQERSKNYGWIYHGMHWSLSLRSKLSTTQKSKDLTTLTFQTHPPKPSEVKLSFRKVSLPPAKLRCFSPLTPGFESFGHKCTPSDRVRGCKEWV